VSHAADNPVRCAREGCEAAHPGGKWGTMKADREGWFHSYQEEKAYCPDHVPEWVAGWRAKKAAERFAAEGAFSVTPTALKCTECQDLDETEADRSPEAVKALRARGFDHAKRTGHVVTVSSSDVLTIRPREAADA
jgi:hypothetical protein